ncbi:MAG TPA: cell envelope integrity protein TolA [Gammaproteobacteria bacterium]|nr:cell envelope integrity protein TolA [Gammaproteobacteria bacterium]
MAAGRSAPTNLDQQRLLPWGYSLLLHVVLILLLVLSFHWSNSELPSLGGHGETPQPVKATVVDQSLINQQMAMLKAEQDKKRQERQQLEQNITDLKQQQASAQEKLNKQVADLQKQAQDEQERVAKLKAEDTALAQRQKTADTAARRRQLQAEIADEEKVRDSRLAGLKAQYMGLIKQKIENNWVQPPSTPDNLKCKVEVHQVVGGTVSRANVLSCNGDDAVRQSIVTAVLKASPLPQPPDPSLFDPDLTFDFVPSGH